MMRTQTWPQSALRVWTLTQRFQKFLVVGGLGLAVNLGALFILRDIVGISLVVASPLAIAISMVVTFILNEFWTWQERGSGLIFHRALLYIPINTVGLIINWQLALYLERQFGGYYLLAQLIGAGVAAVWNFVLNNFITWRG